MSKHITALQCECKQYGPDCSCPLCTIRIINERQRMRKFESGATRDSDDEKLDFEGFISPAVLYRYAQYLHKHRIQADGEKRASDNWQSGMPFGVYAKSLCRHAVDFWAIHRGNTIIDKTTGNIITIEDALCGIIFNASGYLDQLVKDTPITRR